jgi:hypothetical protein
MNIIIDSAIQEVHDMEMAKQIASILGKHYPGHLWAVEMHDHSPAIRLLDAPIKDLCYFIHRQHLTTPDSIKAMVVWAGGEFLERCGLRAGARREGDEINRVDGARLRDYCDPKAKSLARKYGDR